jgi:hypothetical protein
MVAVRRTIEATGKDGVEYILEDVAITINSDREVCIEEISSVWKMMTDIERMRSFDILEKIATQYALEHFNEIDTEILEILADEQADHDREWDLERKYEIQTESKEEDD